MRCGSPPASDAVVARVNALAGPPTEHAEAMQAAAQQHATASAAVAAALTDAAAGGYLERMLQTAPRLLLLHTELLVRCRDLQALKERLQQPAAATCSPQQAAIAVACDHIAEAVAKITAEIPAAVRAAQAMFESLPEDGEVLDAPELPASAPDDQHTTPPAEAQASLAEPPSPVHAMEVSPLEDAPPLPDAVQDEPPAPLSMEGYEEEEVSACASAAAHSHCSALHIPAHSAVGDMGLLQCVGPCAGGPALTGGSA